MLGITAAILVLVILLITALMSTQLGHLRKFNEHSVATALASRVLPVPGGP